MQTIGGHMGDSTLDLFLLNGTDKTSSYKSNDYTVSATGSNYVVHIEFTYKKTDDLIYIQPNRGKSTSVTVNITDLKLYEIVSTGTSKNYGTKYTADELPTIVSGNYGALYWYNNDGFITKITTSTAFTSDSATFDNIETAGTKAYIYGKVQKITDFPVYCTLTADKNGVKWGTREGTSYIINKSSSTPSEYTNNTSYSLSEATYYGHITDGNGNYFTCSLKITSKTVTSKYCKTGEYGCGCSGSACQSGTYTTSCPDGTYKSCDPNNSSTWACIKYISISSNYCPEGYDYGPYSNIGCSSGKAISGTNYCMQ